MQNFLKNKGKIFPQIIQFSPKTDGDRCTICSVYGNNAMMLRRNDWSDSRLADRLKNFTVNHQTPAGEEQCHHITTHGQDLTRHLISDPNLWLSDIDKLHP